MRTQFVLSIAIGCWLVLAANVRAQFGDATYDPTSGSITLTGFGLISGIGLFANHNDGEDDLFTASANDFGMTAIVGVSSSQIINWLFFEPFGDLHPLGEVAMTGLLQTTLDEHYFLNVQISGAGDVVTRVPITGGLIPEPSTMALAGLAILGAGSNRAGRVHRRHEQH